MSEETLTADLERCRPYFMKMLDGVSAFAKEYDSADEEKLTKLHMTFRNHAISFANCTSQAQLKEAERGIREMRTGKGGVGIPIP